MRNWERLNGMRHRSAANKQAINQTDAALRQYHVTPSRRVYVHHLACLFWRQISDMAPTGLHKINLQQQLQLDDMDLWNWNWNWSVLTCRMAVSLSSKPRTRRRRRPRALWVALYGRCRHNHTSMLISQRQPQRSMHWSLMALPRAATQCTWFRNCIGFLQVDDLSRISIRFYHAIRF